MRDPRDIADTLIPHLFVMCSNALRNQLTHANEYLRGATLRFLCKLRERELVQPLVPAITACLGHRVSYVRRNAVLCIHILYRSFGEDVVPDGPNVIMEHLKDERDGGALRNAFQMLFECDQARAVKFFAAHAEDTASYGDGFQLTVLSLARKVCRSDPGAKVVFIRSILGLLASSSPAVAYEAASTLTALSNAPTAIRAATGAFTKLLASTPDNNVKLVLLDRLASLRARGHTKLLRSSALDVLRTLATPNIDIRKRVIELALALVSDRNVDEVVSFLKKQLVAAQSDEAQSGAGAFSKGAASSSKRKKPAATEAEQYRKLLIDAIHTCAVRFPRVASGVVVLLMDFLDAPSAKPVIDFVREACERFPELRSTILEKLTGAMENISNAAVLRVAMWILGQYCEEAPAVQGALKCIRQCVGPLPLTAAAGNSKDAEGDGAADSAASKSGTAPKLLADGTYASQSAVSEAPAKASDADSGPAMRRLLLEGDFFLGSAICSTLCKLSLRTAALTGQASRPAKAVTVDSLLVMAAIIELGKTPGAAGSPMGQDAFERIVLCMRVLADPSTNASAAGVLLQDCRSAFQGLLAYHAAAKDKGGVADDGEGPAEASSAELESKTAGVAAQLRELLGAHAGGDAGSGAAAVVQAAHEPITIRQLRGRTAATNEDLALDDEGEIGAAVAGGATGVDSGKVQQLTGVGDPVYVEALVRAQAYDIVLDMTLVNRTGQTLTDLSVELSTMGDMKVVERPSVHSLGPDSTLQLTYTVKVNSTEASHVYGTLVYTTSAAPSDQKVVNLANVSVDVLNYVQPAYIDPSTFRTMWADFEWENKVAVNTNVPTLRGFVQHIASITHMQVLTPISSLEGAAAFLAANLYARSSFGEDAIMNVSVEKRSDGSIKGHIRIRAKTQGVALSLGDRITAQQKVDVPPKPHE